MIRSSVVFPAPLRPKSATVEPSRDAERHVAQRREIAIIFENAVDFECVQAAPFLYSITPPSARIVNVSPSTQGSCE